MVSLPTTVTDHRDLLMILRRGTCLHDVKVVSLSVGMDRFPDKPDADCFFGREFVWSSMSLILPKATELARCNKQVTAFALDVIHTSRDEWFVISAIPY